MLARLGTLALVLAAVGGGTFWVLTRPARLSADTLASLDAVKGVGPATLKKVAAYALARGFGNERGFQVGFAGGVDGERERPPSGQADVLGPFFGAANVENRDVGAGLRQP